MSRVVLDRAVSGESELVELIDTGSNYEISVHRHVGGSWQQVTHVAATPKVAIELYRAYLGLDSRTRHRITWQQLWDHLQARRNHPSWPQEDES